MDFEIIRRRVSFCMPPSKQVLSACSGNCSVDVAQLVPILLAAASRCRDTSLPTRPNVVNSSACVAADRSNCYVAHCMTLLESNSFMYFAGYLQKRLHACHDCSTCQNVVTVTRPQKIHQHPCFCPSRRIQSNAAA